MNATCLKKRMCESREGLKLNNLGKVLNRVFLALCSARTK